MCYFPRIRCYPDSKHKNGIQWTHQSVGHLNDLGQINEALVEERNTCACDSWLLLLGKIWWRRTERLWQAQSKFLCLSLFIRITSYFLCMSPYVCMYMSSIFTSLPSAMYRWMNAPLRSSVLLMACLIFSPFMSCLLFWLSAKEKQEFVLVNYMEDKKRKEKRDKIPGDMNKGGERRRRILKLKWCNVM